MEVETTLSRLAKETRASGEFPVIEVQFRYQAMRDMYLTEPASFDEILATLLELEKRINQTDSR